MTEVQMQHAVVRESIGVLARHGRTFRLAARFLPASVQDDAAVLYAFCREVDDVADEDPQGDRATEALLRVERELRGWEAPRPVVAALIDIAARRRLDLAPALHLIRAVRSDAEGPVRIRDDAELLAYGYGVAGTVGLLMTGILGGTDPRARAHAIDLGIAMQITNICRDVKEDAERGRVYLPEARLKAVGVSAEALEGGTADPGAISRVVTDLLGLADRYYESGRRGLIFLPWRTRLAIHVAASVYRAIGVRLLTRHGGNPLFGRTVVPPLVRVGWAARGIWEALYGSVVGLPHAHDATLHCGLGGLPYANKGAR